MSLTVGNKQTVRSCVLLSKAEGLSRSSYLFAKCAGLKFLPVKLANFHKQAVDT